MNPMQGVAGAGGRELCAGWADHRRKHWQNSLGCFIAEASFMLDLGVGRWTGIQDGGKGYRSQGCVQNWERGGPLEMASG